jgi:hypothetical protein
MSERGGDTVGCIRWLRRRFEAQNSRNHELYLFLGRRSGSNYRLLYLRRRILRDIDPRVGGGEKNYTARVAEYDSGSDILRIKDILD